MKTHVFRAQSGDAYVHALTICAGLLARGGLVAFPTETVYGLGADARRADAVRRIFVAKGRPSDNPLIVHTADADEAFALAGSVSQTARTLAERFWPGPMTLVVSRGTGVPDEVTAGLDTVGVRVPQHPVALDLLRTFKGPVAAPSANASGRPSPTRAEHVLEDLSGKIDALLDGGETGVGLESTVIDVTALTPRVLRLGGLSVEAIVDAVGEVVCAHGDLMAHESEPVRSPGQKYRHYAPSAPVYVVEGAPADLEEALGALAGSGRFGFLLSEESARALGLSAGPRCYILGARRDLERAARRFYDGLRTLDAAQPEAILAEPFGRDGVGRALYDRLLRASEGRILHATNLSAGDVSL